MKEFALISVQDKKGLLIICKIFKKYKIDIISTGGTFNKIKKLGFKAKKVQGITKFEEILDGRVKTLHPKIHGGLLFDRENNNHTNIINKNNIPIINYLVVNLYDFINAIENEESYDQCIENIDIGGHAMIRAAAKNFKYVTVLTEIKDYKNLEKELKQNKGKTSLNFRKRLAKKAFELIYSYDLEISSWFNKKHLVKNNKKLKYGENPHQNANLYSNKSGKNFRYPFFNKIHGSDISYNNINDVTYAIYCLNDLKKSAVVFVKHANPCGAASHNKISTAFVKALKSDEQSAFGGVVALNRDVNEHLAKKVKNIFLNIIIAPNFTRSALKILKMNEIIILKLSNSRKIKLSKEIKSIPGGLLEQDFDNTILNKSTINCVTKFKSEKKYINDMIFAFSVAKHVKSNAIVLAKNNQVLGIGAGQMSRVDSIRISINKMKNNFNSNMPFVLASDGFFPFADNIELLKNTKCRGIIQPGGSRNDPILIQKANNLKIPMYFTGIRHFRH